MLTARAAEAHHHIGESALHEPLHMGINKLVGMLKEGENLAIVLKKLDYGLVESGERLVAVVLAGIVHSAAVKHISAAVARGVVWDTLLVGKTHHTHGESALLQVVGKLLHVHQVGEHLAQIGIFGIRHLEQLAQIGNSERHALHEVRFLLEVATETVCTKHLQRAEKHEVMQLRVEIVLIHRDILAQSVDILFEELLA